MTPSSGVTFGEQHLQAYCECRHSDVSHTGFNVELYTVHSASLLFTSHIQFLFTLQNVRGEISVHKC